MERNPYPSAGAGAGAGAGVSWRVRVWVSSTQRVFTRCHPYPGYIINPRPLGHGMHLSEDHHHQDKTGDEEDTS
jgi:hypothetical protein